MANKKQIKILLGLALVCSIAIFSFKQQPQPKPKFEHNFKVLPKNISHDSLDKLMDDYCKALNVKCKFCHAESTTRPGKLDMRSDANKTKDEARYMMSMTNDINAKYFHDMKMDSTIKGTPAITCITCHNGKELPAQ